ncbi:unknown [Ruminococcus sp. CAG:382]|nr:unknown [Ruminococcus sp. CAG:382]
MSMLITSSFFCGFTYFMSLETIFFFDWQWMHSAPGRISVLPHLGHMLSFLSYVALTISSCSATFSPLPTVSMNSTAASHRALTA